MSSSSCDGGELVGKLTQGLDDRSEGQPLAHKLDAPALEHPEARPPRTRRNLVEEARLAHACFARHEEDGGLPLRA